MKSMQRFICFITMLLLYAAMVTTQHFSYGSAAATECYYHLHIAKTGGMSLRRDLSHMLPQNAFLLSSESPYRKIKTKFSTLLPVNCSQPLRFIAMFRQPVSHMMSMYAHCISAPIFREQNTNFPPMEKWLMSFLNHPPGQSNATCYSPKNKQSRMIDGLNATELWFVGLVEHFDLSWCLLLLQMNGQLPSKCKCGAATASQKITSHLDHHVVHRNSSDLSDRERALINSLTAVDRVLYDAVTPVFWRRVAAAEQQLGHAVLCGQSAPVDWRSI